VGDEDELRLVGEVAQEAHEAARVGVVEGGVHLVEDAERAGLDEVDRKKERDGRERLFPAGELRKDRRALARRLGDDLDVAFQRVLVFVQLQARGGPAPEEALENLGEAALDLRKGVREAPGV
jgi:hypothetical protein